VLLLKKKKTCYESTIKLTITCQKNDGGLSYNCDKCQLRSITLHTIFNDLFLCVCIKKSQVEVLNFQNRTVM